MDKRQSFSVSVGRKERRQQKWMTSASEWQTEKSVTNTKANKHDDLYDEKDEDNTPKSGIAFEEGKGAMMANEGP
uniref:Uncharacterized protein n=1 Tax=Romanomermis culicivorax TaxID=13658 RepID=A0A915KDQ4_ROMCU